MVNRTFHWADYVVFALSLAVSAAIGIYFACTGGKQKTTEEFLVGERQVHWLPVSLSILGSLMNAVFVIGGPAEVYYRGAVYSLMGISLLIMAPIAAHLFIPRFHRMKVTSAYEYLEERFNLPCRLAAALTFSLSVIIFLAVVLYVPAFAFSKVTGLNLLISILGTGLVCTLYTGLGGIKAVIWTDSLQMLIIVIGMTVLLIMGKMRTGSASYIWKTVYEGGRINLNQWDPHPHVRHSVWTQLVGNTVIWTSVVCSNQMVIQRFFSMKSIRSAQLSIYFTGFITQFMVVIITGLGLVMTAYYHECDPLYMQSPEGIQQPDEIVPYFLMEILGEYHGLPGLLCASIFAASLSSVSSAVNSLAAVFLEDFIKPVYRLVKGGRNLPEKHATWISKILAVVFGLMAIGLSFAADKMGSIFIQIPATIWAAVNGPLFGVFILAFFVPCSNGWGALVGLITGLVFNIWLAIGGVIHRKSPPILEVGKSCPNLTLLSARLPPDSQISDFYEISYIWVGLYGTTISVLVGLIISLLINLITKTDDQDSYSVNSQSSLRTRFVHFCRNGCCRDSVTKDARIKMATSVGSSQMFGETNPALDAPNCDESRHRNIATSHASSNETQI